MRLLKKVFPDMDYAMKITSDIPEYVTLNCIEPYLISIIGRRDLNTGPLLNLTRGGEGVEMTMAIRKKISVAKTNPSLETRQRLSSVNLGAKRSEETKNLISEVQKGKPKGKYPDERRKNISEGVTLYWVNKRLETIKPKGDLD
jgi:hypothetical protein